MIRNSSSACGSMAAGHGGPAEHRRRGARGAADDDVLRRRALEPQRVDHRIADQREEGQHGREQIDPQHQDQHRDRAEQQRERERAPVRQVAGGQRAVARARHVRIDAPVEHVVDCGRRGGGEADAEIAEDQRVERRHAGRRQQRADDRGEHEQRNDPRLGEFEIVAPMGCGERRGAVRRVHGAHGLRQGAACDSARRSPAAVWRRRRCARSRATAGSPRAPWRCRS